MKIVTRLAVLLGAAGLALYFFRATPRDVVLVYDLGGVRDATDLEVEIRKGDELVRRADFPSPSGQIRHAVRLTDGEYHVRVGLDRPGAVVHTDRTITVSEAQTILVPVGP